MRPWSKDVTPIEDRAVLGALTSGREIEAGQRNRRLRLILDTMVPVGELPAGRSQDGLFHTLGNANEWTETVSSTLLEIYDSSQRIMRPEPMPEPTLRIVKGGGCDRSTASTLASVERIGANWSILTLGFRCAKSVR